MDELTGGNVQFWAWGFHFSIYLFSNWARLCLCYYADVNTLFAVYSFGYHIAFPEQTITDTTQNHYEGIIDSGRELALMFDILKDQTSKMNQVIAGFFTTCFNIVQCSKTHFGNPHGGAYRM